MSCNSWRNSQPVCYGYKRGVLQKPQQGASNPCFLVLLEGTSFYDGPGII